MKVAGTLGFFSGLQRETSASEQGLQILQIRRWPAARDLRTTSWLCCQQARPCPPLLIQFQVRSPLKSRPGQGSLSPKSSHSTA